MVSVVLYFVSLCLQSSVRAINEYIANAITGAYYYHHKEPGMNYEETMLGIKDYYTKNNIPYRWVKTILWELISHQCFKLMEPHLEHDVIMAVTCFSYYLSGTCSMMTGSIPLRELAMVQLLLGMLCLKSSLMVWGNDLLITTAAIPISCITTVYSRDVFDQLVQRSRSIRLPCIMPRIYGQIGSHGMAFLILI